MPENRRFCCPLALCSSRLESKSLNDLALISFVRRARERHQRILWISSLLLGLFQRKTAKFLVLFRCFRFEILKECLVRCFSGKKQHPSARGAPLSVRATGSRLVRSLDTPSELVMIILIVFD
jgi:hypothetical protein